MEEGSDSSTDSNSDWVNVHRSPNASIATEESSVDRSSLSSTEGVDNKVNEPASDNNPDQQSFVGRLWSSVPSWSSMASKLGGSAADQAAGDSDFECIDLAGDSEEKKVSGRKKEKSSTGLLHRMKAKWKSEDAVEDNEKKGDDDDNVLQTVLDENTELQRKNTSLLKKLSDKEKAIKSSNSQLQKHKEELQRLSKRLAEKTQKAPVGKEAQLKLQSAYQTLAEEKYALEEEVGQLKKERGTLRESLDHVTRHNSVNEANIRKIKEQAKQFEVEYLAEKKERETLQNEVEKLQQQFQALLFVEKKVEGGADQGNVVIGRLQGRIKQLNEDLSKLREHSKGQSRQIIMLRPKAELTEDLEERVSSMESLLLEAEGERDQLKSRLIHIAATDVEPDAAEKHKKTIQLQPQEADAVELKKSNAKLTSEKSHLEQVLASKVNDIRALKAELQSKEDLQSQVETLQLQVASHKADFEDERRDREAAHSKMADMEKTMAQIKGRTGHEKAALILEMGELKNDRDVVRDELRKKDQDLQIANEELKKHQRTLTDLEMVSQKRTQELQEVKSEHQAKVSQVKQYAKENEKLKKQLETAMKTISVMAEKMDIDREKSFELQDELEKVKKVDPAKPKKRKKWKKDALPDRSEAIEKQMAKLEELYDGALIEIQSLSGENEDLTDQVTNLSKAYDGLKQLWKQLHGRSPATTPTVTKLNQMQLIPCASSQQRSATCEQPLRAGPTDDIISDNVGTAGAGNFLPGRAIPPSQQLPLRARAPDGPPQGDPDKHSTQTKANPRGMRLPLRSKQEPTGRGDKQSFSPQRQRPFSPKRTAKNPPTVKASGASAYGDVSPLKSSGPYPSLGGGPCSITNPPNSDARRILSPYKSAPLLEYNTPHNRDDGEQFLSGGIPSPTYNAEQASGITQRPSQEHLVLGNTDQSNLNRISGPFKRTPAVPEVVTTPPSGPPDGYPQPTTPVSPGSDSSSQVLTKPDRQDYVQSQPSSLPQYDPLKDNYPSRKPYTHPREKDTMSPSVEIPDQVTTPSADEVKPTSDDEGLEDDQEQLNRSANQFENPLQRKLDDEIHEHAVKVMREVSGKQLEESGDESGRPFDPNLICPMCMKKFRIGEIQYFKRHVNTCDGTDGDDWA